MIRLLALFAALSTLIACTNPNDLDQAVVPMGNFELGHNVVVAPNLTKGPASRDASKEEWIASMTSAIDERFRRYDGGSLYHMGISIEGYVLAVPGVPIVASPKSALILKVTLWDDAAGEKLNDKPEQVTVIESFSGETMLGSGLTQTKEVQMENLSRNAAKQIQNWMVRQKLNEDWFGGRDADRALAAKAKLDAASDADTDTADAALATDS
ncbi:hypothetical protein OO012_19575 [Rhodobacteraceae bacterium KMM 6894]|nr:hypothetical protein [Rhodobacteraceae bacterium KMM 6894]